MMSYCFFTRTKRATVHPIQLCYKTQSNCLSNEVSSKKKPLVVMLPWLGATKKAVSKYIDLYENAGCDVIVRKVQTVDFLRPNLGIRKSKQFLLDLNNTVTPSNQPIVIHCTSIGCYFYALMLIHLKNDPFFHEFSKHIKAQVMDSPVVGTLNEMATGISNNTTNNKIARGFLKSLVLCYFTVTKPFTVKLYNQSIDVIKYSPPIVPSLLMTSDNDSLALPHSFMSFVEAWKNIGAHVKWKVWTDSEHAQHLRYHRDEYISLVHQTLSKALGDQVEVS